MFCNPEYVFLCENQLLKINKIELLNEFTYILAQKKQNPITLFQN